MKKVLKWIGSVLGSILGLIILAALGLMLRGKLIVNQVYTPLWTISASPLMRPVSRAASVRWRCPSAAALAPTWVDSSKPPPAFYKHLCLRVDTLYRKDLAGARPFLYRSSIYFLLFIV